MFEANIFTGMQTDHLPEYVQSTLSFCNLYFTCGFCEILSTQWNTQWLSTYSNFLKAYKACSSDKKRAVWYGLAPHMKIYLKLK